MTINANSAVQHVIPIKTGIMINVNASVKGITRARKIIVAILEHVFVGLVSIQKVF